MSLKREVDGIDEEYGHDSDEFFDALEKENIYVADLEDLADFGGDFVPDKVPEQGFQDTITVEIYIPGGSTDLFYRFPV